MKSASPRLWTRVAVSISYDDTHYTTSFVSYYVNNNPNARHISFFRYELLNIIVGPQLFNTMAGPQLQLSASMADNPTVGLHRPKSTPNSSFSKSSNFQDHRFRAWRHSHSSLIYYLGFIMTIVIVISFAHERKLYLMSVHLNKEPNSSKPNQTER